VGKRRIVVAAAVAAGAVIDEANGFRFLPWRNRLSSLAAPALAQSADPDLIFRKSTTFKLLTPNDKLAVYGVDDPAIDGVACHYTAPEKGGLAGAFGLAEQTSDISLACRQYGPIKFKEQIRSGRCRLPRAPIAHFQENADRARLRRQAQYIDLYGLYRQAGRWIAEKLDIERADRPWGARAATSRNAATLSARTRRL
jgi:hypothetical protein